MKESSQLNASEAFTLGERPCCALYINKLENWDSSVGIATAYGLGLRGLIPGKGTNCSLLYIVQAGSDTRPASYPMGTRERHKGPEANLSSPFREQPRYTTSYVSVAWRLIN
jgi:hypothetical protein